MSRISLTAAVAVALNCFMPLPGLAQGGSSLALEEVIVTATKREQSLQDVSVAVTALSSEMLREAQLRSAEELAELVPSLTVQKASGASSSFNIRGVGTQSFSIGAEPSVSTMLDGVVLGRSSMAFMQLLDVQRVEVLRGPQGTLFGKNSTAGVIHVITEEPTSEHTGEIMGTAISQDEYRMGLTLSGPLTDTFGYRLTAGGNDVGGYTRNYYNGDRENSAEEWNVRLKFRWLASDNLEFKWSSDYAEFECECDAGALYRFEPFGNEDYVEDVLERISPVVPDDENDEINHNEAPGRETEGWGHALTINWDIGDYTLTSVSALRSFDVYNLGEQDLDGQPITVLPLQQGGDTFQEQFTQELRLTSPADGRFSYVAGLFFFDQDIDKTFIRGFNFAGIPGQAKADFSVDNRNWAAFGEANWQFADNWNLILGARYTEDELDYKFERTVEGNPIGLPGPAAPTRGGTDEDDLSGKVALQWDFSDDGMAYLSFATGYKGPAFDLTIGNDPDSIERVDPETSESWEVGLKTTLWDGRMSLNVALFHTVYDDFQGQAYFDPDGLPDCPPGMAGCDPDDDPGSFVLTNAGEVSSQGLELDLVAQLTENLRLSGGLALIDAQIDDYEEGTCGSNQQFRGECPESGIQDISGGDLPFSPDWKVNLTAVYSWRRDSAFDVMFRGAFRAQDEVQYALYQDKNTIGDSYGVLDASVQLLAHSDRWEATLFVKNLTDEFYPLNIYETNTVFIQNAYFQRYAKTAERTWGLEARFRW